MDLLRGIAVLAVLLVHYPYFDIFQLGWVGVDLFFVLSGFLISGLLFKDWKQNDSISLSHFWIRRAFKIYPAFYFFLLTLTPSMMLVFMHLRHDIIRRFIAEVFFLQDYLPHLWMHTWSLAVEEQFYLILPLLLVVVAKVQTRATTMPFAVIPVISLLLLIACLALRVVAVHPSSSLVPGLAWFQFRTDAVAGDTVPLAPLHFRADGLFAGVALGYIFHFRPKLFNNMARWWLLPFSILFLVPLCVVRTLSNFPYVLTCNTLAFACLLWWIIPRADVRAPWIERIGAYSYSIYLWHVPCVCIFQLFTRRFVWLVLYLATTILFGTYLGKIVEIRALAVRDKYFPNKRLPRTVKGAFNSNIFATEA